MIVGIFKIFNEEDYIKQAIESIYDYVDRIIILDTCFQAMSKIIHPTRISKDGCSGDRTKKLIRSVRDDRNKIEYIARGVGEGDQTNQFNELLDMINVGDYFWIVDGDEIYAPETAQRISSWMREEKYHCFFIPNRCFWHDFHHVLKGEFWNIPHQRAFMKIDDSFHYAARNLAVRWKDAENNIYGYGIPPKSTEYKSELYDVFVGTFENGIWYHHYAYVRSKQRILEKTLCQYIQNSAPLKEAEWEHCQQFKDPIEFKVNTFSWFTAENAAEIQYTNERHPELSYKTEWWDYKWPGGPTNLSYEEALSLLSPNARMRK